MTSRWALARLLLAAAVAAGAATLLLVVAGLPGPDPFRWVRWWLLSWALFAVAAALALAGRRAGARATVLVLVLGTLVCQLPGLTRAPQTSTDAYRYVWDGRVQLSGTSPYRYAPGDDALADLRDPTLFPGLGPNDRSGLGTVSPLPDDPQELHDLAGNDDRTLINRPRVPTIYPPVAQAWFALVALVTPWEAATLGLQVGSALVACGTTGLLCALLLRRGRDPRWALLWGWSPVVALEAGNNAHVDVLTAALVVAACGVLALDRRVRGRVLGGALIGLAVATKVVPLLLLPALTVLGRGAPGGVRRQLLVPVTTVVTAAATYVPHVLVIGGSVLGYLPAYLVEEGFDDGRSRFGVIALLPLPLAARWPIALAVAAVAVVLALRTADTRRPWDTGVWLLGTALLVGTPAYPWYTLPLVGLLVLARRPEWLVVPVAAATDYVLPGFVLGRQAWAVAAVVIVVASVGRVVARRRRGAENAGAAAALSPGTRPGRTGRPPTVSERSSPAPPGSGRTRR